MQISLLNSYDADKKSAEIIRKTDKLLKAFNALLEITPLTFDVEDPDYIVDSKVDLAIVLKQMREDNELGWLDPLYFAGNATKTASVAETKKMVMRLPPVQPLGTYGTQRALQLPRSVQPLATVISRLDSRNQPDDEGYMWPPELPIIRNDILLERVFRHKSRAHELKMKGENENDIPTVEDYERLEFLGDSFINHVMTKVAYLHFPGYHEGELTGLRQLLISNKTLASWAEQYGFHKRLEVSTSAAKSTKVLADGKVLADTFEAYVAGLLHDSSDGAFIAEQWLNELVKPTVKNIKNTKLRICLLDKQAKAKLYDYIGSSGRRIDYETLRGNETEGFIVSCSVNGAVIGTGWAPNVKDAGCRAAMEALHSPEFVSRQRRLKVDNYVASLHGRR
ncbi:ribonuclease III domain-containing protein [Lipomyces arxii]|uniref:ribonuclease III domain-containing protein n=1 Tax=Lipomyces arxii TaxID=56418 RepID=UPI0034CE7EEC